MLLRLCPTAVGGSLGLPPPPPYYYLLFININITYSNYMVKSPLDILRFNSMPFVINEIKLLNAQRKKQCY